jgi:hypothetical protein
MCTVGGRVDTFWLVRQTPDESANQQLKDRAALDHVHAPLSFESA